MCLGSSINFSIYMSSFPNAAFDSCLAESQASFNSDSFQTARIPFPPPPAVAFSITGYPVFFAVFLHSEKSSIIPSLPGTHGTPAAFIVNLAVALSPILEIISHEAPMNLISCSSQIFENFAFSDRKP